MTFFDVELIITDGERAPGFGASKTKDASPGRPLDMYVILDFRILG